jgi:hypothetical protein
MLFSGTHDREWQLKVAAQMMQKIVTQMRSDVLLVEVWHSTANR